MSVLSCNGCGLTKPKSCYSKRQAKKGAAAKCKSCIKDKQMIKSNKKHSKHQSQPPISVSDHMKMRGYIVQTKPLDAIARVLLIGVYDDNNSLSIFRGMRYIIKEIWKLTIDFNRFYWPKYIKMDDTYCKPLNYVTFPSATNININMMPFIMSSSFIDSKLPANIKPYYPMIYYCINSDQSQLNKIGFLTIDESVVDKGRSQRRPGIHVECPGKIHRHIYIKGDGTHTKKETINTYYWGVGRPGTDDDGFKHDKFVTIKRTDGIYMASSVNNSCVVWNCKIDKIKVIGHLGDLQHLKSSLPSNKKSIMDGNQIYWITDRTPHEALAMNFKTHRQFFRLVTHKVSVWYEMHSTKNPNGVVPDKNITRIIKGSKFAN